MGRRVVPWLLGSSMFLCRALKLATIDVLIDHRKTFLFILLPRPIRQAVAVIIQHNIRSHGALIVLAIKVVVGETKVRKLRQLANPLRHHPG